MDYKLNGRKVIRLALAGGVAVFLLANGLPSTGGTISGNYPHHEDLWQIGRFAFYPVPFFTLIALAMAATACTMFGILRSRWIEAVGWIVMCAMLIHVVASL
jgi:hypothetical protein